MATSQAFESYAAFIDLRSRLVVVVGEGDKAEKKARTLLRYGADLAVITVDPTMGLVELEGDGLLTIVQREFETGDLTGAFAAFCVHSSEDVGRAVFADAHSFGCLVNVAGSPELSNFSLPSIVRRGRLQIAVSTAGVAPAVARRIKQELKEQYGDEWATYLGLLGEVRGRLAERLCDDASAQAAALEAVVSSDLLERIRGGQMPTAEALIDEFLTEEMLTQPAVGVAEEEPQGVGAEQDAGEAGTTDSESESD